jgi:23S rRNA (uracil1939-C5)-methyltransferase
VADCAVLVPVLQTTLEQVRATRRDALPDGLKHIDVVVGDDGVSLAPEFADFRTSEVSLKIFDELYSYNAEAFFQINQDLLAPLIATALPNVTGETALDLYCGVGLFTLPLARRFSRVVGIEAYNKRSSKTLESLPRQSLTGCVPMFARLVQSTLFCSIRHVPAPNL